MTSTETIKVLLDVETQRLDKATAKVNKLTNRLKGLKNPLGSKTLKSLEEMNMQLTQSSRRVQQLRVESSKMGQAWEASKNGVLGFNGALLSTLFFGMEMQRVFSTALKGIFEGYKKIIPENHLFNRETTKLAANWEFFKFQMAEAFAQSPLFQKLVDIAINFLRVLQSLSPEMKLFIVTALGIGAVIGAFLKYVGIIGLGIAGLKDLGAGVAALNTSVKGMGMITKAGLIGAGVLAALVLLKNAMDAFHESSELGAQAGETMKDNWVNTLNSALNPMSQALAGLNLNIMDMNEAWVVAGVVVHNMLEIFGIVLDTVIAVARGIVNVASALSALGRGELDQIKQDFEDLNDTWDTFATNVANRSANLQGFTPALEAYRQELEVSAAGASIRGDTGSQNVTNINVMTATDALADGLITNEQYTSFLEGLSSTKVNLQ